MWQSSEHTPVPAKPAHELPELSPLLLGAALLSVVTAVAFFLQIRLSDFRIFYDSGVAWNAGTTLYTPDAPNLNSPLTVAWVFGPLAHLSLQGARLVWLTLSIACALASFVITARELQWTPRHTVYAAAVVMCTYPAWLAWYQGQLAWPLTLPATLSWRAYRQGRLTAAGLWLAPVIAMKPPFALVALFLPWRIWLPAGLASAAVTLLGIAWTGIGPWLEWWRYRDGVFWITWVDNLSLWAQLGRFSTGDVWNVRLSDLPAWAPLVIALLGFLMYVQARQHDADRRMALAWLAGALLSPIGWVYYLVPGMGAFLASAPAGARTPWLMLCVPFLVFYPLAIGPLDWVVGSIYTVGAVWAWCAYSSPSWLSVPAGMTTRPPSPSLPANSSQPL